MERGRSSGKRSTERGFLDAPRGDKKTPLKNVRNHSCSDIKLVMISTALISQVLSFPQRGETGLSGAEQLGRISMGRQASSVGSKKDAFESGTQAFFTNRLSCLGKHEMRLNRARARVQKLAIAIPFLQRRPGKPSIRMMKTSFRDCSQVAAKPSTKIFTKAPTAGGPRLLVALAHSKRLTTLCRRSYQRACH